MTLTLLAAANRAPSFLMIFALMGIGLVNMRYPDLIWVLFNDVGPKGDAKPSDFWTARTQIGGFFLFFIAVCLLLVRLYDVFFTPITSP